MKHCFRCKVHKDKTEFGKDISRRDGFKPYCKECNRQLYREYYHSDLEDNRKRGVKRQQKYRENPEVQEVNREQAKAWYRQNKKKAIDRRREWRKTPSGRWSIIKSNWKRNKAQKDVINTLSFDDIEFLLVLQNNECAKCYKEFTSDRNSKYTIDHIIPLSLGGGLVLENVQLLCQPCNSSKNNKIVFYRPKINFKCLSFI